MPVRSIASGIEKIDPMLKLQTKEHSSGARRNLRKNSGLETQTPSIIDLSLVNQGTQLIMSPSNKISSKKNLPINYQKMPNMDLIEDVSRASQNLTNELINTNTGFHQENETYDIMQHEEPPNSPITAQMANTGGIPKHTTVGFHRGAGGAGYQPKDHYIEPLMMEKMMQAEPPQTSRYREDLMIAEDHAVGQQLIMKQSPLISTHNNQTNTIMNQQSSSLTAAFNNNPGLNQNNQKRNSSNAMDNQQNPSKQTYSVNPA